MHDHWRLEATTTTLNYSRVCSSDLDDRGKYQVDELRHEPHLPSFLGTIDESPNSDHPSNSVSDCRLGCSRLCGRDDNQTEAEEEAESSDDPSQGESKPTERFTHR